MKKHTVLVSGGAGYIGSHTAVELVEAGFDVVIADNLSNSDLGAVEGVRRITGVEVPFVEVDCCDREALRTRFGDARRRGLQRAVVQQGVFDEAVQRRVAEELPPLLRKGAAVLRKAVGIAIGFGGGHARRTQVRHAAEKGRDDEQGEEATDHAAVCFVARRRSKRPRRATR